MSGLVPQQVGSDAKDSPALPTFVQFLLRVGPLMPVQFGFLNEAFLTLGALIRPFPSVRPPVRHQV